MKLDYNSREIFFGNEALIVADMAKGSNGKPEFTNHKIVTGLVSVGEMEDQAETNNTGNPAVEKNYAKRFVDAINNGGGTAEYREVAEGVHSLSYGADPNVTNEIITYLNRFSWGGE